MDLTLVRDHNSISRPFGLSGLPDFVVLSGANGAGKSNLLEAISLGAIRIVDLPDTGDAAPGYVRLFQISQLVAPADGVQSAAGFRQTYVNLFETIKNHKTNLTQQMRRSEPGALAAALREQVIANRWLTQLSLERIERETDKSIWDWTLEDFRAHAPLIAGYRDPFSLSLTEVFLSYHDRLNRNQFEQWQRDAKGAVGLRPLSDEDFVLKFGPPPWQLLDEILRIMGLAYEFVPPAGTEENLQYRALLRHLPSGALVGTDQLSSGEKTLLSIALTLYMGRNLTEALEMPRVLLLDEADASLHPSMVKDLLRVVRELFV